MRPLRPALPVLPMLVSALCLLQAGDALAGDGVIEINQAKALAGGVTPADAPGFPVTIDARGSYRLTSDLQVPGSTCATPCPGCPDPTGDPIILITGAGSFSALDLNGFSLIGPGSACVGTGAALDCTNNGQFPDCVDGGTADGIDAEQAHGVSIRNGSVLRMKGRGIITTHQASIDHVRVRDCTSDGISTAFHSVISNVRSQNNAGTGIQIGNPSGGWSIINKAHVIANKSNGIQAIGDSNRISQVTASQNGGNGIHCQMNGTNPACLVADCIAVDNGELGLRFTGGGIGGYRECVVRDNAGGTVGGGNEVEFGTNICDTDTTCP